MGAIQIIACLLIVAIIVGLVVVLNFEETKKQPAACDDAQADEVPATYRQASGPDQLDAGEGQLIDWGANTKHF